LSYKPGLLLNASARRDATAQKSRLLDAQGVIYY